MGNSSYSRPRRRCHCGHTSPSNTGDSGRGNSPAVSSPLRRHRHPSPQRSGRGRCCPRASSWDHRRHRILPDLPSCVRCSPHHQAPIRAPPPSPPWRHPLLLRVTVTASRPHPTSEETQKTIPDKVQRALPICLFTRPIYAIGLILDVYIEWASPLW
jgi:hypothetical protein